MHNAESWKFENCIDFKRFFTSWLFSVKKNVWPDNQFHLIKNTNPQATHLSWSIGVSISKRPEKAFLLESALLCGVT